MIFSCFFLQGNNQDDLKFSGFQGGPMKRSVDSLIKIIMAFAIAITYSGAIYSQQDNKGADKGKQNAPETAKTSEDKSDQKEKKGGTYLDIAHAKDNSIKYQDDIRDDIHKLQVVIANFGDANEKSSLETIQKNHLSGTKELFKRNYLNAYSILRDVKSQIRTLYQGVSERYQKKTNEILGRCADVIVEKEIGSGNKEESSGSAAKTSRKITTNKIKLNIAYGQLNTADKYKFDERLAEAVTHYRIAKIYGIGILLDMAESEGDKTTLKNEFKTDQMDSENQISK